MKPRLFIYIHYLEIGGAERALLGLLHSLAPEEVDIDLFLNQHTGEFLKLVPEYVNLLPQLPEYSAIERPMTTILREGHLNIALRRLIARLRYRSYQRSLAPAVAEIDDSIYQYIFRTVSPALRSLNYLGEYDLALSFLHPHNIVADKVKARKKACWIHTDYSSIHVNHDHELPVWQQYDYIYSISPEVTSTFSQAFPELKSKISIFENITSPVLIRLQADEVDVSAEMPKIDGCLSILSIGRFSAQKRFDDIPQMARIMLDRGLKFKWYLIGFGPDEVLRQRIDHYNVADCVIILGKKANPYPYIKSCDIYAQPSLYEGKCVAVREAQILCRPVVISNYPTAKSQITDGVDGAIAPLEVTDCANGICDFALDTEMQKKIVDYLETHNYGNADEVQKIYHLLK